MAPQKQPKVILFDIGGVVVVSPFQAILDYELNIGIPPGWVNYSISRTAPDGFWHKLERGDIPMDDAFFRGFSNDLHDPIRWETFYRAQQENTSKLLSEVPPLPRLDAHWLFHEMMTGAQQPDPWMFPALQRLKDSRRYILAAVSNTVIFPPGHRLHEEKYFDSPIRRLFDVFISSAHVGMRKPDPKVYSHTLKEINDYTRKHANADKIKSLALADAILAEDVVFLDDIGENLKAAKALGFQTIKVNLGRAFEAVDELERITGLKLAGDHPRIPIQPNYSGTRSKI